MVKKVNTDAGHDPVAKEALAQVSKEINAGALPEEDAVTKALRPDVSIFINKKGGCGKSAGATALYLQQRGAKRRPLFIECDTEERQKSFFANDVIFVQVKIPDDIDLRLDPRSLVYVWDEALQLIFQAIEEDRPVVVDMGANLLDLFLRLAQVGFEETVLESGEGITFVLPISRNPFVYSSAQSTAETLVEALPKARFVWALLGTTLDDRLSPDSPKVKDCLDLIPESTAVKFPTCVSLLLNYIAEYRIHPVDVLATKNDALRLKLKEKAEERAKLKQGMESGAEEDRAKGRQDIELDVRDVLDWKDMKFKNQAGLYRKWVRGMLAAAGVVSGAIVCAKEGHAFVHTAVTEAEM